MTCYSCPYRPKIGLKGERGMRREEKKKKMKGVATRHAQIFHLRFMRNSTSDQDTHFHGQDRAEEEPLCRVILTSSS
jgi:hypothetical protein